MQSKLIMLVIIGLTVGGALAGGYYFIQRDVRKEPETVSTLSTLTPTPVPVEMVEYEDPAGFNFTHPDTIEVTKGDNAAAYSDLILTSDDKPGQMLLSVTDTKLKSAEAWVVANTSALDSEQQEIPFGDIEAIEIATASGITTVAYDQGALFLIRVEWDEASDFWRNIYDTIITSFAFWEKEEEPYATPPPAVRGGSSGDGIIFEGEEIL